MQISVVIVNYNVKYFLEQCLYSVREAARGLQVETIVIDNRSTDGSLDYLRPRFPEVLFVANDTNAGFARACNLGARRAGGRFVLFLNPDTLLAEDTLRCCLHFFETHAGAGAAGVKMIDGSGAFLKESKRAFPSPLTSLYKLSGLAGLFPRSPVFSRYYLGHLDEGQDHAVEVLAGAFMMVRREVLDRVGGFDEDFFMYGEDIDLSYRIRKSGFQNYYLAGTTIIHFKGESTKRGSLNYVRVFYGAMSIFVRKHYGGARAGLFRLVLQAAIWMRASLSAAGRAARWITRPLAGWRRPAAGRSRPCLLVAADAAEYAVLQEFLRKCGLHDKVIGRLAVTADSAPAAGRLSEAGTLAGALGARELVLCAGSLSYRQIISFVLSTPVPLRLWYHRAGSGSMVGSASGTSAGETLAAEDRPDPAP
ncbi:glycosyltransferase family 2 protein [Paraflavisolibacter sp. H34]|uniref:glycosyltransferase family 2 protein n=1 Tax=Huijunlia imazamoxiresistens TaxID=3127457 RepID=UPI0030159BD5